MCGAVIAACRMPDSGRRDGSGDANLVELEDLRVGSVYGVGSGFESGALRFAVDAFGPELGNVEVVDAAAARPKAAARKSDDKETPRAGGLRLSHAKLDVSGAKFQRLEFAYTDRGGPVAIRFAGVERGAEDLIELDGCELDGVKLSVEESSTAGVRSGRVVATGRIQRFSLCGADLEVAKLRVGD